LYLWLYLKDDILRRAAENAVLTGKPLNRIWLLARNAKSRKRHTGFALFAAITPEGRSSRSR